MPLEIIRHDITSMQVDAIVNPTNEKLLGTGGVDGVIHQLEGPELFEQTSKLGLCKVGEVKLTPGLQLPAKHIIHTVGPLWVDGNHQEESQLRSCYRNALELALKENFESIAFPLISSGTYGYPKDQALNTAISTIGEFLLKHELLVYLVVYDKISYQLSEKLFTDIKSYIDDQYVEAYLIEKHLHEVSDVQSDFISEEPKMQSSLNNSLMPFKSMKKNIVKRSLDDVILSVDHTFSEMLLRLIDEKGLKDSDVYKKANIDRKHFSKIRSNKDYTPSKKTTFSFAIALELSLDETKDLLQRAGYAISTSSKFDLVIQYFIEEGIYDIFKINETLFKFTDKILS